MKSLPIRVIIVDDEPLARDYLKGLLADDDEIEIVALCGSGKEAVLAIRKSTPDIVFLDVQMPGLDGFGVIRSLDSDKMPAIIFVTAFDKYAIRAFEAHAAEYLLKPFDRDRLSTALDHVKQNIMRRSTGAALAAKLQMVLAEFSASERSFDSRTDIPPGKHLERIPIKTVGKSYLIKASDVDWIESADSYLLIHAKGKQHVLRESMKWVEEHLDPDKFFRIHRQAIVNIDKIKELQAGWNGGFRVFLEDGAQLQLSRRRRKDLERLLGRSI